MSEHLVVTLAAPIASFGAVAVGERRPTWDRPSKSQVIGLVAGALGIERTEEERQNGLAEGLGFAVRIDDPGRLANDYHTAQAAKEASIRRREKTVGPIRTRADELECDDVKTILSMREFRSGTIHTIALWSTGGNAPDLAGIARALAAPAFAPFAGRKAHPLMLPMAPRLVTAEDIPSAFAAYDAAEPAGIVALREQMGLSRPSDDRPIFSDIDSLSGADIALLEQRRDALSSRAKWRFDLRTEALLKSRSRGDMA